MDLLRNLEDDNPTNSSKVTDSSNTASNTEVFILPPHILRKYGINLQSLQPDQGNNSDAVKTDIGKSAKISTPKTNLGKKFTDKRPCTSSSIVPGNELHTINIAQNALHDNMCRVAEAINAIPRSLKITSGSISKIDNSDIESNENINKKKTECTFSNTDKKVNASSPESSSIMETASLMKRSIFLSPNMIESYQTDSSNTIQSPQSIDKLARTMSNEPKETTQQNSDSFNTNLMENNSQNNINTSTQCFKQDNSEFIPQNITNCVTGKNICDNNLSTNTIKHNVLANINFSAKNVPYSVLLRPQDIIIDCQPNSIQQPELNSEPKSYESSNSTSIIKNNKTTGKVNILSQCIIKPNQLFSSASWLGETGDKLALYNMFNNKGHYGYDYSEINSEKESMPKNTASRSIIIPEICEIENIGSHSVQYDPEHEQCSPIQSETIFIEESKESVEDIFLKTIQNTSEPLKKSGDFLPMEINETSGSSKSQDITTVFRQLKNTEHLKLNSSYPVKSKSKYIDSTIEMPSSNKNNDVISKNLAISDNILTNEEKCNTNFANNDPKQGTLISDKSPFQDKVIGGSHVINVVNEPNKKKGIISQLDNEKIVVGNAMEIDIVNSKHEGRCQNKMLVIDQPQATQNSDFFLNHTEKINQAQQLSENGCAGPNYSKENTQEENNLKIDVNNLSSSIPFCSSTHSENIASNLDPDTNIFNEDKPSSILSDQRSITELILKFHSDAIPYQDSTNKIHVIPVDHCNAFGNTDLDMQCPLNNNYNSLSSTSSEYIADKRQNEVINPILNCEPEQTSRKLDQDQNILIVNEISNNQNFHSSDNGFMNFKEDTINCPKKITPKPQYNSEESRSNSFERIHPIKYCPSLNTEEVSNNNVVSQNIMDIHSSTLSENLLIANTSSLDIDNNLSYTSKCTNNVDYMDHRLEVQIPKVDSAFDTCCQNGHELGNLKSANINHFSKENENVAIEDSFTDESTTITEDINKTESIPINIDLKLENINDNTLIPKSPESTKINMNPLQGIKISDNRVDESQISFSSSGSNIVSDNQLKLIADSLKKAVRQAQFKVYKRVPKIIQNSKYPKTSVATYSKPLTMSILNKNVLKHNKESNQFNLKNTANNMDASSSSYEKLEDIIQSNIFDLKENEVTPALIQGMCTVDNENDDKRNLKHSLNNCSSIDHVRTTEYLSPIVKNEKSNLNEEKYHRVNGEELKVEPFENALTDSNDKEHQYIPASMLDNIESGDFSNFTLKNVNCDTRPWATINDLENSSDYSDDNVGILGYESYFDDEISVGEEVEICDLPKKENLSRCFDVSDILDVEKTDDQINNSPNKKIKRNDDFTNLYLHNLYQHKVEVGEGSNSFVQSESSSSSKEIHDNNSPSIDYNTIKTRAAQFISETISDSFAYNTESNLCHDFQDKDLCTTSFENNDKVQMIFSTVSLNMDTVVDGNSIIHNSIMNDTSTIDVKSINKENLEAFTLNNKLDCEVGNETTKNFNKSMECLVKEESAPFGDNSVSKKVARSFIASVNSPLIIEKLENVLNNLENDNLDHVNVVGESNSDKECVRSNDDFPLYLNEPETQTFKDGYVEFNETKLLKMPDSSNLSRYSQSGILKTDIQPVTETIANDVSLLRTNIDITETYIQSDRSLSISLPSKDIMFADNQQHYETSMKSELKASSIPTKRKYKNSYRRNARRPSSRLKNKRRKIESDTIGVLKHSSDLDQSKTNSCDDIKSELSEDNLPLNIVKRMSSTTKQTNYFHGVKSTDKEKNKIKWKSTEYKISKVKKKNKLLTCAECDEDFTLKSWPRHNLFVHNNLAWTKGDEPIDFSNEVLITAILRAVLKSGNGLICNKCKIKKKSVDGFLSHRLTCGKSYEEINSLKSPCPLCQKVMLPLSLKVHIKMCQREQSYKNIGEKDEKIMEETQVETLGRKRKAAEKAKITIKVFGAELNKVELKTQNNDDNAFFKKMKSVESRMINNWLKQIEDSEDKMCVCINTGCGHKDNDITKMSEHINECPMKPELVFQCNSCNVKCNTRPEIMNHSLNCSEKLYSSESDVNPQNLSSESEYDQDDYHSVTEDDDIISKTKLKIKSNEYLASKVVKHHYDTVNRFFENPQMITNWMIKFCRMNYSTGKAFLDASCLPYRELSPLQKQCVLNDMLQKESCNIAYHQVKTGMQYVLNGKSLKWKKYRLLESEIVNDTLVFFCGGTVNAIAWLPLPQWDTNCTIETEDHLAISVTNDPDGDAYIISDIKAFSNVIQLWSVGKLNNSQETCLSPAKMVMGLAHNHGNVWDMKWCPSGCFDSPAADKAEIIESGTYKPKKRLGLLAAACSDGDVCVFSIAHPSELPSGDIPLYQTDPVFILRLNSNNATKAYQPTKISWSESKGHSIISAGYSNGIIALFDICITSPLVRSKDYNTYIFKPYYLFQNTFTSISGLVIFPDNIEKKVANDVATDTHYDNELLVGFSSASGVQVVSRVGPGRNSFPVFFRDDVTIISITKLSKWPMLVYVSDEPGYACYGTWLACPMLLNSGHITYKSGRLVNSNNTSIVIDASPWVGLILQGFSNGMVKVIFPFIADKNSKHKNNYSYPLSKFDMISLNQNPVIDSDREPKNAEEFSNNYGIILTSFLARNPTTKSNEPLTKFQNCKELPYSEHGLNLGSISHVELSCNKLSSWYVAYACNAGIVNVSYFSKR